MQCNCCPLAGILCIRLHGACDTLAAAHALPPPDRSTAALPAARLLSCFMGPLGQPTRGAAQSGRVLEHARTPYPQHARTPYPQTPAGPTVFQGGVLIAHYHITGNLFLFL